MVPSSGVQAPGGLPVPLAEVGSQEEQQLTGGTAFSWGAG